MEKIAIRENKVLKLNNVLIREVSENELIDLEKIGYMMDSYIKSKGNASVGPIINYTKVEVNENGEPKVNIKIMVQLKSPIHSIESPYEQKNQLRIANCLFARFTEKEENLKFAYDKMHVYSFENDIKLKGDSYTVLVKQEEENIVADVFMETVKGGEELESL